ncbi:hypothetical protein IT575_13640 [bacterium]|nr:hypothetical protein [bacterium]
MDGYSSGNMPTPEWREPLGGPRCPKCHSRMKSSVTAYECVYCHYTEAKPIVVRARGSYPWKTSQAEATDPDEGETAVESEFQSYELPRINNIERHVLILAMSATGLAFAWPFGYGGSFAKHGTLPSMVFYLAVMVLPVLLAGFAANTTLPALRFATMLLVFIAAGLVVADGSGALSFGISLPLSRSLGTDLASTLYVCHCLTLLWGATFLWRDTEAMCKA